MSVGLVHDYLLVMRGAERTFAEIAACRPDAPIHTLLYDPRGTGGHFEGRDVRTSYLQLTRPTQANFRRLLPLFPRAASRLDVREHDLVLSSSSAFAHGVQPRDGAVHVCYCHSPFRYAWHERQRAIEEVPAPLRPLTGWILDRIRAWDLAASRRVDHYIANSEFTRERIARFYGREASVIHPPVAVDRFAPGQPEDWFLMVGEVVPHKQVELALEAARRSGQRIRIVGAGRDLPRLRALYDGTAEFLGRVSDAELAGLYARARALVVPNVEEFGIAAVEAQAAGRPVVAADAGGARETVVPGETGLMVPAGDVDALAEALRYSDYDAFEPQRAVAQARRFSSEAFREALTAEVSRLAGVPLPAAA